MVYGHFRLELEVAVLAFSVANAAARDLCTKSPLSPSAWLLAWQVNMVGTWLGCGIFSATAGGAAPDWGQNQQLMVAK
jgi:hypothetical protein